LKIIRIINQDNHLIIQGTRFFIVGVSNAVIGLGIIYVCYNLLHVNYMISNGIGYCCGLINSFIWNKKWTFKSKTNLKKEIILFFVIFLVSYSLNLFSVIICVEKLHLDPNLAQIAGIFLYTSSNFLGNKYVTFQ